MADAGTQKHNERNHKNHKDEPNSIRADRRSRQATLRRDATQVLSLCVFCQSGGILYHEPDHPDEEIHRGYRPRLLGYPGRSWPWIC